MEFIARRDLANRFKDVRPVHRIHDKFEWAERFEAHFDLVKIGPQDSFRRIPRPSVAVDIRTIEQKDIASFR